MKRWIGAVGVMAAANGSAAGQSAEPWSGWETETDGDVVLTLAPGWGDETGGPEPETMLYEIGAGLRAERVLDNGAEIGARLVVRAQRDHPDRAAGTGAIASDLATAPGAFTGVATGADRSEAGPRARLEAAYIYIDGGYGEVTLGRDVGVASRFQEGPQSVFSHARVADALLDPSGLTLARARLDTTGSSAKVSYATPRLLGLRAGASYTPSTEADGLDRSAARAIGTDLEDTVELAANLSRPLGRGGPRLRAAAAYTTSDVANGSAVYAGSAEAWSLGLHVEGERLGFGVSHVSADDARVFSARAGASDDRVRVWTAGFDGSAWTLDWSVMGSTTETEAGLDAKAWSVGVGRSFFDGLTLSAGFQGRTVDAGATSIDSTGVVLEITQSW